MARRVSQRELRNESGEIMRALDRGEEFVITRNGTEVGELRPVERRRFVPVEVAKAAFAGVPRVDVNGLRADLDAVLDQDPAPRG